MDDLIKGLRNQIIGYLKHSLVRDYNELTSFLKAQIIELLHSKYGAEPVENDPSHVAFSQIGEIHGEHYPVREKDYSAWVANSMVVPIYSRYGLHTLEEVMGLRQREVDHARETGTRITRDLTVIFSPNTWYLVEDSGEAEPSEFENFVNNASKDIMQLMWGIAERKDAFEFCPDIFDPNPDLSLRINDDIIRSIYNGKDASPLTKKIMQDYKPEKPNGISNVAA